LWALASRKNIYMGLEFQLDNAHLYFTETGVHSGYKEKGKSGNESKTL
jgi:hypothetical protein